LKKNTIVSMQDIVMSFSGNQVLKKVNFELEKGEVHAIMGANGAGKSTLIKILNGIYHAVSGTIIIDGERVSINSPSDAEKLGLAFVHQELNVCQDLSVAENMYMGNMRRTSLGTYDKKGTHQRAKQLLELMGVDIDPYVNMRYLRTAEKQIVEILKALTQDAKVVVLDEPTSSLNEREKQKFFEIIQNMKDKGVSIIFISHFLEDIMAICDRVTVIRDGVNSGLFYKGKFTKDELVDAMMGQKKVVEQAKVPTISDDAEIALELSSLCRKNKFKDISLKVKKGDILGICGLLGAGKTELARTIFGLDYYDSGKIVLFGEEIKPEPYKMVKKGVSLLTEERKSEGFVPLLSIRENATMSILSQFKKMFVLDRNQQNKTAELLANKMTVKMSGIEQTVGSLSGGNQQKVVIAKCLANEPKLFILDEPTRGVDVYAKSEIYNLLRKAAAEGRTILIFSSELEELLENCSQIVVLKKGKIQKVVKSAETSKNELLSIMG